MLDYTRTLTTGSLGRYDEFTRAILEFVIENNKLFEVKKEEKVRYLMRKLNETGGYKMITSLKLEEIKKIVENYAHSIKAS